MQALNIIYVLIAVAMVALVLVQKGAGATAGAAFGSGASGTVFGARGAGNFLTRSTWVLATLFCTLSLLMAVMVSRMSNTPKTDLGVLDASPAITKSIEVDATDPGLAIPDAADEAQTSAQSSVQAMTAEDSSAAAADSEAVEVLPSVEDTGAATSGADQQDPASGSESDGS